MARRRNFQPITFYNHMISPTRRLFHTISQRSEGNKRRGERGMVVRVTERERKRESEREIKVYRGRLCIHYTTHN